MSTPDPPKAAALRSPVVQAGAEAAAFAMLALAASGWLVITERKEIAREFAQDWLRQQGVEASFDVRSLEAGAFTGAMRVGPAAHPIFEADRVEVAYDLTPPWAGGPFNLSTRAIRVVRPRLHVTFDGRKFSAGALDPLISDFLKRPKTIERGPAVLIEDSLTTITTPNGTVRLAANAALDDGKLLRLDGRLLATRLKGDAFDLATSGGTIRLRKAGETLSTDLRLSVDDFKGEGVDLHGGSAAVDGSIPYPDPRTQALAGPAHLRAAMAADGAKLGEAAAARLAAHATLNGVLAGNPANATLKGRINGAASLAALDAGALKAQALHADFSSSSLSLARTGADFPFTTRVTAKSASASGYEVTNVVVAGAGGFHAVKGDYRLAATGDARADGGLPAARARRIARATPVVSGDPAQEQAIAAALQRFSVRATKISVAARNGDLRVALSGPVKLDSPSGAHVILTPHGLLTLAGAKPSGGFDLSLNGGGLPDVEARVASWTWANGALDARLALKSSLNAPPAQHAVIEADGRLHMRGGRTTFDLVSCGRITAELVDFGETDVAGLDARVCSSGGPLIVASNGAWRVAGRFEDGEGAIPIWSVAGSQGAGVFDVSGHGDMDRAAIKVSAIRVADTQDVKRFNPVRATGQADLVDGVWRGAFPIATDEGRALGEVSLIHDAASGRGHADIDARALVFAKDGLQPAQIAPMAEIIRDAEGPAGFTGTLSWGPEGVTSSGDLAVVNLNFRGPVGQISGLNTRLHFTSLAPLVTALAQTLTIDKIAAITPLEQVSATFDLAADTLHINAAAATLAKGQADLEPLTAPLATDRTITGVLNLHRIDVGLLVADSSLADKIKVNAIVDGRLPFEVGPQGFRIRQGHLVAVQPGRISISRTVLTNVSTAAPVNPMDATPPAEEFNAVQDFAYQAMENLSFDVLEANVNSVDNGRLDVLFKIQGHHDPAKAEEARISIQDAIAGTAFKRRIPLPKGTPVNLTLDTSLNFDELIAAWKRGWVDAAEP